MLMKRYWRYNQENADLWKEIVQAKKLWEGFSCNTSLQQGNEAHIQFWKDKWRGHTKLQDAFPRLFLIATNPDSTIDQNW
ncbi:hypothetical protein H5410_036611 [Solanum commersonii]|uniref:Uncharacterized protein n=1 Tax=Solanum commersonii TaxID=4109 RepID=A0A9J5Y412_SOLCO|nr:hypothetical protein H5410_036611 [Solanum commersonii]